jgi:hypothetical protein
MSQFSIGENNILKTIPNVESFVPTIAVFPLEEYYNNYVLELTTLDEINPNNIYDLNNFPNHNVVFKYQLPLRELKASLNVGTIHPELNAHTKGVSKDMKLTDNWFIYWEVLHLGIFDVYVNRLKKRKKDAIDKKISQYKRPVVSLRGLPIRSFHICDALSESVQPMQKTMNHIESTTSLSINWSYLGTYRDYDLKNNAIDIAKDKSHWILGVDGVGKCKENMRSWRNKISTVLRVVDVIISNSDDADDLASIIAFTLINLAASGSAIINLPTIINSNIISLIHLFSLCFENCKIIHTYSGDRLFLVGDVFLGNLNANHHKILYDFIERSSTYSIFNTEYMNGEEFTNTVETLLNISRAIFNWRIAKCQKIIAVSNKISTASSKIFSGFTEKILSEEFPDETNKYINATNFDFFIKI